MATVAPLPHRSIYRGQHSDPLSPPPQPLHVALLLSNLRKSVYRSLERRKSKKVGGKGRIGTRREEIANSVRVSVNRRVSGEKSKSGK